MKSTNRLTRMLAKIAATFSVFFVSVISIIAQTTITIAPTSPYVSNCIPFGNNTSYGFTGFVYRNIPAFTLNPGDKIRFDMGQLNNVDVRRNIYFASANINPAPYSGISQGVFATSWVQVVNEMQIPLNPKGNTIVGDFELTFTAISGFSFAGGGFIIGFGATPPGSYSDTGCEQVGVSTNSSDASGFFYQRFYQEPHLTLGVLDATANRSTYIQGFKLDLLAAPPTAICKNATVYLDNTGNVNISPSTVNNGSTAPAGLASLMVAPNSFNCSDIGPNLVTLTITDINSNSDNCNATVTVLDTIPPMAVCKNFTVYLDATGSASINASDVDDGSSDNCGISTSSIDKANFSCSDIGANNVKLTVTDASGNADFCVATVTVLDTVPPTAVCKNISVDLVAGMASISGSDVDGGSNDACGIASLSVAPNSFDCSNIGANNVTLTVTDNNGNVSMCNAVVTIVGEIPAVSISQGVLPGFCQGGAVVLTADAPTAVSYLWSEGSVTNPINVYSSGTYSVVVTNSYGCTNSASTIVNYDATELLSSYTILADNATLNSNSEVLNGGLGVKSNFGFANVMFGSNVTAPGTFVKAPFITTVFGSITNKIYAKADVPLPSFKTNPYGGAGPNLYVPSNSTVVINDSIFGYITIGSNAKVTFSSKNVYARQITMYGSSKMDFTNTCPVVCISQSFSLSNNCKVNTINNKQPVFYVQSNLSISSGSTFNASAYMNGDLSSNGTFWAMNQLKGMFIANNVNAYRTDFNWEINCNGCSGKATTEELVENDIENSIEQSSSMTIYPNPSDGNFNVRINSAEPGTLSITVNNLTGQVILQTQKEITDGNLEFSLDLSEYPNGIYFVKTEMAGKSTTQKIIISK